MLNDSVKTQPDAARTPTVSHYTEHAMVLQLPMHALDVDKTRAVYTVYIMRRRASHKRNQREKSPFHARFHELALHFGLRFFGKHVPVLVGVRAGAKTSLNQTCMKILNQDKGRKLRSLGRMFPPLVFEPKAIWTREKTRDATGEWLTTDMRRLVPSLQREVE